MGYIIEVFFKSTMELLDLYWHTYNDHLKEMMKNLMQSQESSDVTLVCEDKTKFKAHKLVLNACSPVFQLMINELPQKDPVIYLRGILAPEMKSILQFMYLGQATFFQERMNDFFNVAKSLEIKEISKNDKSDGADPTQEYSCDENIAPNTQNSHAEDSIVNPRGEMNEAGDKDTINANSHEEALKVVQEWCVDTEGAWLCKNCEKVCPDKQKLKKHFESHVRGLSYKCDICLQTFRSRTILA